MYKRQGIDEEQWQVFDCRDGSTVERFIKRLSDGAKAKWESHYGSVRNSKLPDLADTKYIATLLRGDFDFAVSLSAQLRNANDALIALTKEQYRCLDQLDDNPRCLIQGPAGTGKTLLAIEEVKKSAACGEKVALFCFNTNLADWLSNYFEAMPETWRPGYVGTFHKFMTRVAKNAGILPAYPRDPDQVQQYYQTVLPDAAAKALMPVSYTHLDVYKRQTHNNTKSFLDRFKVVAGNLTCAQTVVAHISRDGHYFIHPDIRQNRSITPREAARIQTFPDNYYFESVTGKPSRTRAYKQIGNAVPVCLAYSIAAALLARFTEGEKNVEKSDAR